MKIIINDIPSTETIEKSKVFSEKSIQNGTGIVAYETNNGKGVAVMIRNDRKVTVHEYGFCYITRLLNGECGDLKFIGSSIVDSIDRVLAARRKLMLFNNQREFFEYLANSKTFDADNY